MSKIELEITAMPIETLNLMTGGGLRAPTGSTTTSVMFERTVERPAEPRRPLRQRGLRGWLEHRRAMKVYRSRYRRWVEKGSPATETATLRTYIPRAQIRTRGAS